MNVAYACPVCRESAYLEAPAEGKPLRCPQCEGETAPPPGAREGDNLHRCLVCHDDDLFVRKDFPQRLGLTIVVIGFLISCIPWYFRNWTLTFTVLAATALIDAGLYLIMGNVLECYRCHAIYRGAANMSDHGAFDLEIHEKHRQHQARLAEHKSAGA